MCNVNSTTEPLSCRNWELYTVECRALMDELMRDHPGLSARDAHQCASAYVDSGMLEQFAADWDAMVALFAAGETVVEEHPTGAVVNPTGAEPELPSFHLYVRGGYPVIVEVDTHGKNEHVPFGIMVKDHKASGDDMRWFEVQPDAIGTESSVRQALAQNELLQYIRNPQSVCPTSPAEPRDVSCRVYRLDGTIETFTVDEPDNEPEPPTPAAVALPEPATERARNKAAWHLAGGLVVRFLPDGSALVPSANTANVVYRVSSSGQCTCPAGEHGRHCWHVSAVDLLLEENQAAA